MTLKFTKNNTKPYTKYYVIEVYPYWKRDLFWFSLIRDAYSTREQIECMIDVFMYTFYAPSYIKIVENMIIVLITFSFWSNKHVSFELQTHVLLWSYGHIVAL